MPFRDRLGISAGDPDSRLAKPLDSSIRWTPDGYVDHARTVEQPFDLFVDHLVLRDVTAHLLGARTNGSFGLLTGKLRTCSSSEMPYVRIRNAHPAEQPFPETEDMGVFRQHLKGVAEQAELDDEEVLGWYHAHNLLGVTLSARDSLLHMEHFHQPWHCALVIVPERRRPKGGFFTRLRGDGFFRHATVPFFEVGSTSELGDQPAPSYVGWQNYEADRPFTRLLPDQPSAARPGGTRGVGGARPPDDELEADHPVVVELVSTGPAAPEAQLTPEAIGTDPLVSEPGDGGAASKSADVVVGPTARAAETSELGAGVEATEEPAGAAEAEAPLESADSSTGEPAVAETDGDGADESADVRIAESAIAESEETADARTRGPRPARSRPEPDAELPAPVEAAKTEVESLEVIVQEAIGAGSASELEAQESEKVEAADAAVADAAEDNGAGPDAEAAVELGVEEGQTGPALDPLLKKRLEALRHVRAFRESPDYSAAHPVTREVADPEAGADAVAAREFLWQRWSRRSARSDNAE